MNKNNSNNDIMNIARVSGFAYLGIIIFAIFAEGFVRGNQVFIRDGAKTLQNILDNQLLWRFAMVSDVFTIICDLIVTAGFYFLLKPYGKVFAINAAVLRLSAVTILAIGGIFHYMPMFFISENALNGAFNALQLQNLTILSMQLHNVTYHISLIIFGLNGVVLGCLFYKSKLIPQIISIGVFVFGWAYFFNSVFYFIWPDVQKIISTPALMFCLIAELSLSLWLIIKGVDLSKWNSGAKS